MAIWQVPELQKILGKLLITRISRQWVLVVMLPTIQVL